jgi:DNA-binding Lrp family transcriptional regulator
MSTRIEKIESVVNELTGELLSLTTETTDINTIPTEPNYLKLYIDDLGLLKKLSGNEMSVLLEIAATADYSGEVHLVLVTKERIAQAVGVKLQTINNTVVKLDKKGILKRKGTAVYMLNPDLFAKGKWRDIREQRKAFQSITTYTPDGKRKTETRIIDNVEVTSVATVTDIDAARKSRKQSNEQLIEQKHLINQMVDKLGH